MKIRTPFGMALASLLAASVHFANAQTADRTISTFDTGTQDTQPNGCGFWYGTGSAGWDASQDATGNSGGSLYIKTIWGGGDTPLTEYVCTPGNNLWWNGNGTYNSSDYKSLQFDIKWDNTSTITLGQWNAPATFPGGSLAGSVPGLEISIASGVNAGLVTLVTTNIPAAATSGWVHMTIPINPNQSGIDPSVGIFFKKWLSNNSSIVGTNESGVYTNTANFWIDNVILEGTAGPPPPPTVSLASATPGLGLVSASGGAYDRQNIVTVAGGYSWIGASGDVSYAVDIAQLADNAHPNYEFHMFFVSGAPDTGRSDPDWHEPNVLRWDIGNNGNGGAYSTLRYKTNAPDGNGIYYSAGQLGGPGSATATGTWKITFNNDTNVTATSPDGTIFSTNLPPSVAAAFANPLKFYAGVMPGNDSRVGQLAVLSRIKIDGTTSPALDSQLVGQALNGADWATNAASAIGVQEFSTNSKYWMRWTLPAVGFSPQISGSLSGPWTSPTLFGFEGGGTRQALVSTTHLPGGNAGYFRLIKRVATKLQVLLPGETNAPETASGKAGPPDPVTVGNTFAVTINSVDSNWNVTSGVAHTVHLALSPVVAGNFINPDVALANGTATIDVQINIPGTYTITATDVTDGSLTADTSTSITVP